MLDRLPRVPAETAEKPVKPGAEPRVAPGPSGADRPVQRSPLVVGAANDPAERNADVVAEQVMHMIQRGPHAGLTVLPSRISRSTRPRAAIDVGSGRQNSPLAGRARRSTVPRSAVEVGPHGGALSAPLAARIRGSGARPLGEPIRSTMESAFGTDLSQVRIQRSSDVAPRLGAAAFTLGSTIHFAPGAYSPDTQTGQRLLAHELTHTLQNDTDGHSVHRYWVCGNLKNIKCQEAWNRVDMSKNEKPDWECSVCGESHWEWRADETEESSPSKTLSPVIEKEKGEKKKEKAPPEDPRQPLIRREQQRVLTSLATVAQHRTTIRQRIKKGSPKIVPNLPARFFDDLKNTAGGLATIKKKGAPPDDLSDPGLAEKGNERNFDIILMTLRAAVEFLDSLSRLLADPDASTEFMASSMLDDLLFSSIKGAKNCITSAGEHIYKQMESGGIKKA
jgi:hypothetical protein